MQDELALCRSEFEEELVALLSIYDSELHVERKVDGCVSLKMKMCPAPPAFIKASVTLHLPAAVRICITADDILLSSLSSRFTPRRIPQHNATYLVRIP
jgi:hypothetical protein